MKRILFTTLLLFVSIVSFSGINIPDIRFYSTHKESLTAIYECNSEIDSTLTIQFKYVYPDGYKVWLNFFRDSSGYLIGVLSIDKYPSDNYMFEIYNVGDFYMTQRTLVDFRIDYDRYYKLFFNDSSSITIEFDRIDVKTGYKCRFFYLDQLDEKNYRYGNYHDRYNRKL